MEKLLKSLAAKAKGLEKINAALAEAGCSVAWISFRLDSGEADHVVVDDVIPGMVPTGFVTSKDDGTITSVIMATVVDDVRFETFCSSYKNNFAECLEAAKAAGVVK